MSEPERINLRYCFDPPIALTEDGDGYRRTLHLVVAPFPAKRGEALCGFGSPGGATVFRAWDFAFWGDPDTVNEGFIQANDTIDLCPDCTAIWRAGGIDMEALVAEARAIVEEEGV